MRIHLHDAGRGLARRAGAEAGHAAQFRARQRADDVAGDPIPRWHQRGHEAVREQRAQCFASPVEFRDAVSHAAMRAELGRANHRLALGTRALRASDPVARVARDRHRLENLQSRMVASLNRRRDRARYALQTAVGRLDSLSPLAVLGRGYSLTRTPTGEVVHSPAQVNVGDAIRVLLHRGSLDARVTERQRASDKEAPEGSRISGQPTPRATAGRLSGMLRAARSLTGRGG